jgi:hypothetical protein
MLHAAGLHDLKKKLEEEWKQRMMPADEWEAMKKVMNKQTLMGAVFSSCKLTEAVSPEHQ